MAASEKLFSFLQRIVGFVLKKGLFFVQAFLLTFVGVKSGIALGIQTPVPPQACRPAYLIAPGETLTGLARRYLGDGAEYPRFLDDPRNGADLRTNPDLIYIGAAFYLPDCRSG